MKLQKKILRIKFGGGEFDTLQYVEDYTWKMGNNLIIFNKENEKFTKMHLDNFFGHYVLSRISD